MDQASKTNRGLLDLTTITKSLLCCPINVYLQLYWCGMRKVPSLLILFLVLPYPTSDDLLFKQYSFAAQVS
jgi:hypothetical protein